MFLTLLIVTFIIAVLVTFTVASVFKKSVSGILDRLLVRELSTAWQHYMTFAVYVVGISGGVRIWELEKYINPRAKDQPELILNRDRWVLEVYRTVIETLQSVAWLLLAFFVVALVAYVIVEIGSRFGRDPSRPGTQSGVQPGTSVPGTV